MLLAWSKAQHKCNDEKRVPKNSRRRPFINDGQVVWSVQYSRLHVLENHCRKMHMHDDKLPLKACYVRKSMRLPFEAQDESLHSSNFPVIHRVSLTPTISRCVFALDSCLVKEPVRTNLLNWNENATLSCKSASSRWYALLESNAVTCTSWNRVLLKAQNPLLGN